jgi:type I restriction enzyme S subunit
MCKAIVGMANINAQEFQDIKILIPPIELQTQFAEIVSKAEILKEYFKESLQELENLYGSLSQQAFKGKLEFKGVKEPFIGDPVESVEIKDSERILQSFNVSNIPDRIDLPEPKKKFRISSPYEDISSLGTISNYKPVLEDLQPFIQKTFHEKYFTFDNLKQATINAGWQYDFETLKNFVFELLRKRKLKQIFADAAFKSTFKEDETDAQTLKEVKELSEQMYLQRTTTL